MISAMPPNIFSSSPATAALITLILIENSQEMFAVWDDLCQHYLPTLLGSMRVANPVVPIPVLWLTTTPVRDDAASFHSAPPREYNQLPELKFSFSPDNRITSRIIHKATEYMLEAATQFQGRPVSFHLFLVAASPPVQGTWGISVTMPSQIGHSEWRLLGQRIAQLGIHCHMILPASQHTSSMSELFTTSLELQGHTQVSPWFPISSDYTVLLSGDSPDPQVIELVEQKPPFQVARPPVLRHQSFPQDVQSASPTPSQNGSTPTLVSSLQKVHGLSRKKLYGTQPPRQPFVREEPVRTKYKSTPTPLSIPVGSQPFPILEEDARVVTKTKVERGRRADRLPGDLSNSTSPGRKSPWNRVPSDVGSSPSSPAACLSSLHITSPTIPLYPDLSGYPTSPPVTSASLSPSMVSTVPIPETSFTAPLQDPSGAYFSISPSFQSPPLAVPAQAPGWASASVPTSNFTSTTAKLSGTSSARRHSQELAPSPHMQNLGAMSCKYRLDIVPAEPRPTSKIAPKVKDAGDVPFIFSPEQEAATAAKLKAALQSTPVSSSTTVAVNQFPVFTSGTSVNYAATGDAYDASSQPPRPFGYDVMQDACPTTLANGHVNGVGDGGLHRPCFVGSTSSSLQGWAG